MLSPSLTVVLLVAGMGFVSVFAFAWALYRGGLDDPEAQARSILDERDLRLRRVWETEAQAKERMARHGGPIEPRPGEWGGAK